MDLVTFTHEDFVELSHIIYCAKKDYANYYSFVNMTDFIDNLYHKVDDLACFTANKDFDTQITIPLDWVNRRFDI